MDKIFDAKVAAWLEDSPSNLVKLWRTGVAFYYRRARKAAWVATHWISRTVMASIAPAVAYFSGSISGGLAMGLFAGIFFGHTWVSYAGTKAEGKTKPSLETVTEAVIRIGDILSALKISDSQPEKHVVISASLGIVEVLAREITGLKKGDISVSLVAYEEGSTQRMKVLFRNPGNERPMARLFNCENLLGHRACQSGPYPRIVNDLKGFGKAALISPTQSRVNYRSILFLPIATNDGNNRCGGFLSIDAALPYAFHGEYGKTLLVTAQPIIGQIQSLL